MTIWQAIFLGLLQGLTEFLPVSSSGHLLLAEKLLGIGNNMFLNVLLHTGSLLAVCIVLRKSIVELFKFKNKKLFFLLLATLPTIILGFAVKLFVPENLLNGLLPIGFAVTIVLLLCQYFFAPTKIRLLTKPLPPLITGIAQGIAVLPGLSRSGCTIATLTFFGIERKTAAEFSFLLSIPVIIGATVIEIFSMAKSEFSSFVRCEMPFYSLLIAVTVSFVTAMLSLKFMLKIVQSAKLYLFAIYLFIPLVLSLIVL